MTNASDNTIYMPVPTEETVTTFEERVIEFPDGSGVRLRMCPWHWQMVTFFDTWNEHYQREAGVLFEWFKSQKGIVPLESFDREFSDTVMIYLRELYENAHDGLPEGERRPFDPPAPGDVAA